MLSNLPIECWDGLNLNTSLNGTIVVENVQMCCFLPVSASASLLKACICSTRETAKFNFIKIN